MGNDLSNVPEEKLKAELGRREQERRLTRYQQRIAKNELILKHIDVLLTLTEHCYVGDSKIALKCRDDKPENGYDGHRGRVNCVRCYLLKAKQEEYLNEDLELEISISYHPIENT